MVNRNEVVAIADRLHAAGERVSVRAVREGLRRGGSFGDVGPMVADWKLANNWRARPVPEDLPVEFQDLMDRYGASLWAKAKEIAKAELGNERGAVEARLQADLEVRADIGIAADALERRVRELEARLRASEAAHRETVLRLRHELRAARSASDGGGSPGSLQAGDGLVGDVSSGSSQVSSPVSAGEDEASKTSLPKKGAGASVANADTAETPRRFWDGVMHAVAGILSGMEGGRASASVLHGRLDAATLERAAAFQVLDAGLLATKMAVRADREKYFFRFDDGSFGLRDDYGRNAAPRRTARPNGRARART
jgi:hypothetical protein